MMLNCRPINNISDLMPSTVLWGKIDDEEPKEHYKVILDIKKYKNNYCIYYASITSKPRDKNSFKISPMNFNGDNNIDGHLVDKVFTVYFWHLKKLSQKGNIFIKPYTAQDEIIDYFK